jgi:hypothetical protein
LLVLAPETLLVLAPETLLVLAPETLLVLTPETLLVIYQITYDFIDRDEKPEIRVKQPEGLNMRSNPG